MRTFSQGHFASEMDAGGVVGRAALTKQQVDKNDAAS